MCTIVIEAVTPFCRTSCIKLYKDIARSRLFCRIAKRSIVTQADTKVHIKSTVPANNTESPWYGFRLISYVDLRSSKVKPSSGMIHNDTCLKGLFHPAYLACVVSWLGLLSPFSWPTKNSDNKGKPRNNMCKHAGNKKSSHA